MAALYHHEIANNVRNSERTDIVRMVWNRVMVNKMSFHDSKLWLFGTKINQN